MPRIIIAHQEKNRVPHYLEKLGADIVIGNPPTGDYIISNEEAFEYKSPIDFMNSQIGPEKMKVRRQILELIAAYPRPALLIGGSLSDLLAVRKVNPNAIFGMLQDIIWLGCPIRFLQNEEIAANYIFQAAKKAQGEDESKKAFSPHGKTSHLSPDAKKVYTMSAVDDVGPTQAVNLLKEFGSIKKIANADIKELMEVELIGIKTAEAIRETLQGYYFGGK